MAVLNPLTLILKFKEVCTTGNDQRLLCLWITQPIQLLMLPSHLVPPSQPHGKQMIVLYLVRRYLVYEIAFLLLSHVCSQKAVA